MRITKSLFALLLPIFLLMSTGASTITSSPDFERSPPPVQLITNMHFELFSTTNPNQLMLVVSFDVSFTSAYGGEPTNPNRPSIEVSIDGTNVYSSFHNSGTVHFTKLIPTSIINPTPGTISGPSWVKCSGKGGDKQWRHDGCVVEIDPCIYPC